MENLQWIFDGIGTELLSLAIGAIAGGLAGYKVGVKKSGKQTQKAKSGAKQRQELIVDDNAAAGGNSNVQNNIRQVQKAGKNSEQVQIGRINDGR
ncbi:MAG: hypothetical protein IKU81_05710 [Oscillibacter sp.]|nr:hypothetical protein [Oscillibacter sp.]